jgi:transposase
VGLDIILELFMSERDAASAGIVGSDAHLELRRTQAPRFEPKSPMGEALRYLKNQWARLRVFLQDPLVPIHNNASEAALRIVALMKKNSLFFGHELAGRRFMTLYSLIATCERHDINPEVYLTDVLIRLQDHPADRVAELLPHRWKETFGSGFTVARVVTPGDAA